MNRNGAALIVNSIPRGLQARHVSTQGERSEPWAI